MSFFERFIDFFETLFAGSSPQYAAKRELRKLENELKTTPPVLKAGMIQPIFARALVALYKQSNALRPILSATLYSETESQKLRCLEVIMTAGFTEQMKNQWADLTYEKKKTAALEDPRAPDAQQSIFEKMLNEIATNKNMQQVQTLLQNFDQLNDICSFDYIPPLKCFNRDFTENADTTTFFEVSLELAENFLMDIYYLTAGFTPTNSLANALYMLKIMQNENNATEAVKQEITTGLRAMAAVLSQVVSSQVLKNLLCIAKKNIDFELPSAKYETPYTEKYCKWQRTIFAAEKAQIAMEVQNEQIAEDLRILFDGRKLFELTGYNSAMNEQLHLDNRTPFLWVLPMQTVKSFFLYFLTESQEGLLDRVVVEGFFTDQMYQSSFAAALFSCKSAKETLAQFEARFDRNGETPITVITGLINAAKRNVEDGRQLDALVAKCNADAKKILEDTAQHIAVLAHLTGEIIADFKQAKSELISNLKVLFLSARNKEAAEMLDRQYPFWLKFLAIMSKYVLIKKP